MYGNHVLVNLLLQMTGKERTVSPMDTKNDERCAVSFSGGKDSFLALDRACRAGYRVDSLVTLYDEASQRVRFHGVPIDAIQAQADAVGIPLLRYPTRPEHFEATFLTALHDLRRVGVTSIIFGNIHLADVRAWYEERTTQAGLRHHEPLWGEEPGQLVREGIARGYLATLTCIDTRCARAAWLGALLDEALVQEFEQAGIDPCGEHGEYHTFVHAGPLFRENLALIPGKERVQDGFRQIDIQLGGTSGNEHNR
jgi:uncharacterized protein (TIGR00290 family)